MMYFTFMSVCMIAVCYTQSFDLQQPLINTKTFLSKQGVHEILKRQGDINQDSHCGSLFIDEACMNGLLQEEANFYHRCNYYPSAAIFIQQLCIFNSRGNSCLNQDTSSIERNFQSECNSTSSTCSHECRNTLIINRYELDCCIPSFYNNTALSWYIQGPFNYSTWSSCDVEPVSQQCTPSSVTIPATQMDPMCNWTDESFAQWLFTAICKR